MNTNLGNFDMLQIERLILSTKNLSIKTRLQNFMDSFNEWKESNQPKSTMLLKIKQDMATHQQLLDVHKAMFEQSTLIVALVPDSENRGLFLNVQNIAKNEVIRLQAELVTKRGEYESLLQQYNAEKDILLKEFGDIKIDDIINFN